MAVLPMATVDELAERRASHGLLFRVQHAARDVGYDPAELIAGWGKYFRTLTLEVGRASEALEAQASPSVLLERNRQRRMAELAGAGVIANLLGSPPIAVPSAAPTRLAGQARFNAYER
jgi:hypothetical protein